MRDVDESFWESMSLLLPKDPTVFDLGAHGLEEAQALLPRLQSARWYSFEPNPECCNRMRHTIHHNKALKGVTLIEAAIGREDGSAVLYRSGKVTGEEWTASSSTRRPKLATKIFAWMKFDDGIAVRQVSLDSFCASQGIGHIDFMKMDIQGAEIDAVLGGQKTLSKTRYVLTECCKEEEYDGQVGLETLIEAMPGKWEIVEKLLYDTLLVNTSMI